MVLRVRKQQVLRQGRKRQETQTITGAWVEIISNSHETKVLQPNGDQTEHKTPPFPSWGLALFPSAHPLLHFYVFTTKYAAMRLH